MSSTSLEGGCPCGLIRYRLTQPPLLVHCCHCTACQRQTGSAFALNAIIESTSLQLLPSAPASIPASSSSSTTTTTTPSSASTHPIFASLTNATPTSQTKTPTPTPICLPSESGLGTTVLHCPSCLAGLWSHYPDAGPHVSYLRVGTLDRAWEVDPDLHIYTRSRRAFVQLVDGKPQFEAYYPSREALLKPEALERWEALKPMLAAWRAEMMAALTGEQSA